MSRGSSLCHGLQTDCSTMTNPMPAGAACPTERPSSSPWASSGLVAAARRLQVVQDPDRSTNNRKNGRMTIFDLVMAITLLIKLVSTTDLSLCWVHNHSVCVLADVSPNLGLCVTYVLASLSKNTIYRLSSYVKAPRSAAHTAMSSPSSCTGGLKLASLLVEKFPCM